jgi:hypothetical protein
MQWPRPPLVLGFILGKVIERYMFISIQRYGFAWMLRPVVLIMLVFAVAGLLRSFVRDLRAHGGVGKLMAGFGAARIAPENLLPAALVGVIAMMLVASRDWSIEAKIIPLIVVSSAMVFWSLSLANDVFGPPADTAARDAAGRAPGRPQEVDRDQKIHMDVTAHLGHLPTGIKLAGGAAFFGWLAAVLCSMAAIGLIATVPVFVICYMRFEGRER